jgi:MOSC domain-containing protein YiiM
VFIGDVYEIGSAVVQACQPRSPCYKIARRYGRKDMPVVAQKTGRTGILLRVLVEGEVAAPDEIRLRRRGSAVTLAEASRILDGKPHDLDGARRLLDLPALGSSMRSTLEARLLKASAE